MKIVHFFREKFALVLLVPLLLVCTELQNPYLITGKGNVTVNTHAVSADSAISIFSTFSIVMGVNNPTDIASITLICTNNRLWTNGDTTLVGDLLLPSIPLSISITDTGAQSIVITTRFVAGDSTQATIPFRAQSPLSQADISCAPGDSMLLSTPPVLDKATYVWTFPNGQIIERDTSFCTILARQDFSFGFGTLSITVDSLSSIMDTFGVIVKDTKAPVISFVADSSIGDTILTSLSQFKIKVIIKDGSGELKNVSINGLGFDSIPASSTDSIYLKTITNLDTSHAPLPIVISAEDRAGNIATDTIYIRYDKQIISIVTPQIIFAVPATDTLTIGDSSLILRGTVIKMDQYDSLYLYIQKNSTFIAHSIIIQKSNPVFSFPITVLSGLTTISAVVSRSAAQGADSLAASSRTLIYTPGVLDKTPPIIASVKHNGKDISGSYTVDSSSISLTVTAFDAGSGIAALSMNGQATTKSTGETYSARISLTHSAGGNTISIVATDSANNTTTQNVSIIKNSRPHITMLHTLSYAQTKTLFADSMRAVDVDGDNLSMKVQLTLAKRDTSITLSPNGLYSFTPDPADTLKPIVGKVSVFDGYTTIDSTFIIVVQPPLVIPVPQARFTITAANFPESLMVARDSLRKVLSINQSNAGGKYLFSARIVKSNTVLLNNTLDSVLRYIPTIADTGAQTLELVIKSDLTHSDTVRVPLRIVMPPPVITVSFDKNLYSGLERNSLCTLTLAASLPLRTPTRILFDIASTSTAKALINYKAPDSLAVTLNAGSQKGLIIFTLLRDNLVNGTKTIDFRLLSAPNGVLLGIPSTATYSIIDIDTNVVKPDTPSVSFVKTDSSGAETNTTITVGIALSKKATASGSFTIKAAGSATRRLDYNILDSAIAFVAGDSIKPIRLQILDDTLCESANETIILSIATTGMLKQGINKNYVYTILPSDTQKCNKNITMIYGVGTKYKSDSLIVDSLKSWGFYVTRLSSDNISASGVFGANLIFVSQSVAGPLNSNNIYDTDIPLVCANSEDYVKCGFAKAADTGSAKVSQCKIMAGNPVFSPYTSDIAVRLSVDVATYPLINLPTKGIIVTQKVTDSSRAGIIAFSPGMFLADGNDLVARRGTFSMAHEENGQSVVYQPPFFDLLKNVIIWTKN